MQPASIAEYGGGGWLLIDEWPDAPFERFRCLARRFDETSVAKLSNQRGQRGLAKGAIPIPPMGQISKSASNTNDIFSDAYKLHFGLKLFLPQTGKIKNYKTKY